ncbi:MAG TPA: superoxide dismutase family protein [Kofleriaceae bacterium]
MKIKLSAILFGVLFAAACGGKKADPVQPEPMPAQPDPAAVAPEPAPAPTPEPAPVAEPAPPPAPKMFKAKVELAPVKGAKMKAVAVSFTQEEGKPTKVELQGAIEGLKPGKYHLVVHEAAECGPNATKAGKIWATTEATPVTLTAAKGAPAALDTPEVQLNLDGDASIVGKTIVLHDDKKGKPGKAQACGAISADGGMAEAAPAPAGDKPAAPAPTGGAAAPATKK